MWQVMVIENNMRKGMIPSIFNDVLGPIMRGPSSSHSAGALRIGRLCRDLMGGEIKKVLVEYDPNGSLVTTHTSQGTDMGLYGGFLGWEPDENRLPEYQKYIHEAKIDIKVSYVSYGATHPNTYKLTLWNDTEKHEFLALSTGGGMIKVVGVDGVALEMDGDCYELLIYVNGSSETLLQRLNKEFDFLEIHSYQGLIQVKNNVPYEAKLIKEIEENPAVSSVKILNPVLPVLKQKASVLPFLTVADMMKFEAGRGLKLWELAVEFEKIRSGKSAEELWETMRKIAKVMQNAIKIGLAGTHYEDRILPSQSPEFQKKFGTKETN